MKTEIKYIGEIKDKQWPHFLWRFSINGEAFDYKTGSGHQTPYYTKLNKRNNKPSNGIADHGQNRWIHLPTTDDILHALFSDLEAGNYSFDEFCDQYGYSNDSLSALDIYRACSNNGKRLRKALGPDFYKEQERIRSLEL